MTVIKASPTKAFFTSMLTRDIDLDDAILDLLDNSLDGLLRQEPEESDQPYSDFNVAITLTKDEFTIEDNCGGIPKDIAENYAFRFGKPPSREDDDIPTVGMFGIGMKRALFKMGSDIKVISHHTENCFYVEIKPEWLESDDSWVLEMLDCNKENNLDSPGTRIIVKNLNLGISQKFSKESDFESTLTGKVQTHYAYIIKKGLSITINGKPVSGLPLTFLGTDNIIEGQAIVEPYVYEEDSDGVYVRVFVGMIGQAPSLEEIDSFTEDSFPKSTPAGWTVICNERVVLYADRTILTGWGDRLPRFHQQFNQIVGVVEFRSNSADKLPITTTKRGIDASADLYLRIRKRMIEGMRIYIDYTNKWKNNKEDERKEIISNTKASSIDEILKYHNISEKSTAVKDDSGGRQYKPKLPMPSSTEPTSRFIRYSKLISDIQVVSDYIFDDSDYSPADVGEACFDKILGEAKQ